ncbi:MAG: PAS domain S-box protein, partial [Leptospiraceae bacterium]|nr:PAS domain S-box protein [Leptospiraceae bacterium]
MPNSKKILLVEDIKVVSLKLNTILHKFGYDVLTANSGESAINQLSSNPQVNLILMDIDLGKGMSGVETATKILKKREIPIIFLTSYEDDEFIDQVRGVTRYGYLLKDSGDSVLKSTIEMALELFESRTALKKSERTLSNLMDSFPGIVYRYRNDTSKTLEFISRGCLDVCGTPSTDFMEKKTIHLRDLIFENEKDWVEKEINFSLNKKERFIVNYRIVSALKEVKWVEDQGIGVYSDSGELIAVEGFIEDITSRKSAEYALVESEERLKSIIEASNDGIWEWEIQTNKIYWSEKVYLMLGYSKKEFYSNYDSVLNLVHPEDRQKSKEDVRAYILSEEPFSVEIRFQKKDGNYGYFLCKGQVKKNSAGQTFGLIGSISDISERKIAEKKIKESLKFVNTIIELSPIGILTYNSKGECISVNPAACEIAGGSLDEFKKKSLWDLITVKDSKLSALIQEVINKNVSKQLELHGRSSFGKEFWIQAYLDS